MDITQGELVCNNCGHVYPINEGIPNMLLVSLIVFTVLSYTQSMTIVY